MTQIEFNNLSNLTKIDLSFNNLSQIYYASLVHLINLEYLDLSFNRIDYIEERIFNVGNLERKKQIYLNLQSNRIVSLGERFVNYLNLEVILLSFNNLIMLPNFLSQIWGTRYTREIHIDRNKLSSIGFFSPWVNSLKILNFDSNQIVTR